MAIKTKIISICSEKGGVGKTTTTINLAGGLAKRGKEVLILDLDQQQNASHALGYVKDGRPTTAELIYNTVAGIPIDYAEAIRTCGNGVDYIPSSPMLTNITGTIANDTENDSNFVLRRLLFNEVFAEYDYILLDCRTILDLLISNALNASDYVIIPVDLGIYAYNGLDKMLDKVASINNTTNRSLRVLGVLLNKLQLTNVKTSLAESIRSEYSELTFKASIPYCPAQTELAVLNQTSSVFDERSSLGTAFMNLTDEVISIVEE